MRGDGPPIKALPPMPDWELAGCRSHPHPDFWSSGSSAERREAMRVCASCPVRRACAEWSLSLPAADQSIWGGMPAQERKQRKAARSRLATVPAGGARHNAVKDECDHGHKLAGDNLVLVKDPRDGRSYRQCRECRRERTRGWMARQRLLDHEAVNAAKRADYAANIEDQRARQRRNYAASIEDRRAKQRQRRARYAARKAAAASTAA